MELKKNGVAGTYESSDAHVIAEPNERGVEIHLQSSVMAQYGDQIRETVLAVLRNLEVQNVKLTITDKGALDCTIRARVETALFRGAEMTDRIPWGAKI